jgi:hypothetical protein
MYKKLFLKANKNKYGTPLSISSNGLQCTFDELEKLIQENFSTRQKI